jgi:Icc-related predicted phosphoesterase
MRIAMVSDIHGRWSKIKVPEVDVLISCGDYSFRGEERMVRDFHAWMYQQPAKHRISVQGNHEVQVEQNFWYSKQIAEKACPGVHFIDQGDFEIDGIKFYGSAITPWFLDWAWNKRRGEEIQRYWDIIPDDTQVLITHGPPAGILDAIYNVDGSVKDRFGCQDLMNRIGELKDLKLHCFGHIHGSSGEAYFNGVKYINASICDETYYPINPVRIIEI